MNNNPNIGNVPVYIVTPEGIENDVCNAVDEASNVRIILCIRHKVIIADEEIVIIKTEMTPLEDETGVSVSERIAHGNVLNCAVFTEEEDAVAFWQKTQAMRFLANYAASKNGFDTSEDEEE